MSAIDQFTQAMVSAGIVVPPEIYADGKLHRFSTSGARSDDSGWYVLHDDGVAAGAFGCWRSGQSQNWSAKADTDMTQTEREALKARIQAMKAQRDADKAQRQRDAAQAANHRWQAATPVSWHPYLENKGVQANGLKAEGDGLLIPMRDTAGALCSLQVIAPDGSKRFQPGGKVAGCYHAIGKPNGPLVVCEGYATGASIHEATGHAVAIAFNAGNLLAVARALHAKYPTLRLVVAADDDWRTEGNPGLTKAREAAQAVGGLMAVPRFPEGRGEKDTDFNDLHQAQGLEAVAACMAAAVASAHADSGPAFPPLQESGALTASTWPEPREIKTELPPAPRFDAHALLPKPLADFVLDEADRMPCAPDYIAAALIVCLGSVLGARCAIKPKRRDDWIVTPNLFGGIVGDPSTKKSPAMGTVMRFLDRLEAKEAESLEQSQKLYEAEMASYDAHQAAIKASMKKAATGKGDPDKMAMAVTDLQTIEPPEEPRPRRFKSNDSTTEKLGDLLASNPQGLLVCRDELMGLLASWEKDGREGDRAFYLEAWNGVGSFNIDRIARGSLHIPNLCLSVFGGIQPDLLERYLANMATSLDNDGRIQRFQVLVYPEAVPWQWRDRYPVSGAREAVRNLFQRLAYFDPVMDGAAPADDFVKLPHFCFDEAAQAVFVEWATELNTKLIPGEANPMMRQHFGKFEKLFCALALILHLSTGEIGPVKVDSALRAAAWCEYLAAHARRVYGLVEAAKVNTARMVARRIAEGKLPDGFTVRDVMRKQWTGVTTGVHAEAALAVLEDHGVIASADAENYTGRPTTRHYINPSVWRAAA